MLENTFCGIEDMMAVHYAPLVPVVAAALGCCAQVEDAIDPLLGGSMPTNALGPAG